MDHRFSSNISLPADEHRSVTPPKRALVNRDLLYFLTDSPDAPVWVTSEHYRKSPVFVALSRFSGEYQYISHLFHKSMDNVQIHLIERVENPYLMCAYLLKKRQLYGMYGFVNEIEMFHATKLEYVLSICENNFNWRYHGMSRGHKFGKGVSFAPRASYAHMFSDKNANLKVMFLVNVLMNSTCVGNESMLVPPVGFNSSQKDNGDVIVKYEDNEFYPKYVISYYETISYNHYAYLNIFN